MDGQMAVSEGVKVGNKEMRRDKSIVHKQTADVKPHAIVYFMKQLSSDCSDIYRMYFAFFLDGWPARQSSSATLPES